MKLLNYKKDLFTEKVWSDIKDVNTRIVQSYMEIAREEEILRPKIDTYFAEVGGFEIDLISLSDITNEPVNTGMLITGKFELLIFPHERNKDIPFGMERKFTVFSKDDLYARYEDYINYCWGMWDRRKPQRVVYRHEFRTALTPDESNELILVPDEYINKEGERIKITDLKLLRNLSS